MDAIRQLFPAPGGARAPALGDTGLAARYAYPDPGDGPWLRANMVSSLDGASTVAGRSGGLAGEADRQVFAMLRALADVILVGAGTARAEGYQPVRPRREGRRWAWLREGRSAAPPIAVLTRALNLDPASPLLAGAPGSPPTIVVTTRAAPPALLASLSRSCDVIVAGEDSVALPAALTALSERGHRRILTEGGPHLLGQLIEADLLDELCLTVSPLLAGPGPDRIVAGPVPAGPAGHAVARNQARPLVLRHVLASDGYLFCRYQRPR